MAIGTLTLAAATMLLAWSTQRAAKATALDVSAQCRPAIVPGVEAELIYTPDERLAMVTVRNVGRGPAFHVEAALGIGNLSYPPSLVDLSDDELMSFAIFRVDEAMDLYFTHLAGPTTGDCKLLIDYDDVNGNAYSSRIEIREVSVYEPHEYKIATNGSGRAAGRDALRPLGTTRTNRTASLARKALARARAMEPAHGSDPFRRRTR